MIAGGEQSVQPVSPRPARHGHDSRWGIVGAAGEEQPVERHFLKISF